MSEKPRRPVAIRLDAPDVRVAAPGADAGLMSGGRTVVVPEAQPAPESTIAEPIPRLRRSRWGAILWAALGGLASLTIGVWVARLVEDLFALSGALGWVGLVFAGAALLAVVVLATREIRALLRLGRVERLRTAATTALDSDDRTTALAVARDLRALYADRPDMAEARADLDRVLGDIVDGADLVRLTERTLMGPLDAKAITLVLETAKRVSLVTAVAPRAVFDVAVVAGESLRLVRRLADLYGARPGRLGLWRLGRAVVGHLVITGGMAMGESLVEQLLGHGLAARLSAKLGEGIVNGLMTARVGLACIDLVRPMPFAATERPKLGAVLAELGKLG